jgi:hypothetical protein
MAHADGVVPDLVSISITTGALTLTTTPGSDLNLWPAGEVWLWREREAYAPNFNASGGVPVTHLPSGVPGVVSTGTLINSYLIHGRNVSGGSTTVAGTLTFNFDVLGVIALNTKTGDVFSPRYLTGSDPLGHPDVDDYPRTNSDDRGLDSGDSITISGKTLTFSLTVGGAGSSTHYDQIRILTAAPEPAAIALFGTVAAVLLGAVRWRKRRARS